MLVGMAFNILIARITRFKYIYLTGHATLYMACMIAVILSVLLIWTCAVGIVRWLGFRVSQHHFPSHCSTIYASNYQNDTVALGHTGNFGYTLSGLIGKYVGDKEKSTEDINFPKACLSCVIQQSVSLLPWQSFM